MTKYDFHFETDDDGVATLTLDRPDTLNSLTFEIYGQLSTTIGTRPTTDASNTLQSGTSSMPTLASAPKKKKAARKSKKQKKE